MSLTTAVALAASTAVFVESDARLLNPGMGWVVYGDARTFDEETLDYASVGYRRFEWHHLQPAEEQFNWKPIEDFLAAWHAKGKQAAFGVMAANSHSQLPFVTPRWVFEAGAEYRTAQIAEDTHGRQGEKVVPNFGHPVYLEKLEGFLTALAAKYDGDPRLAFLDIRSYGNWGEAHMSHLGGYPPLSDERFLQHVKLHRQAFRKTKLILPLIDDLKQHRSVAAWAIENGIGVRRDGIMGNSDGSETAIANGREPGIFEWYQNYEYTKANGWWDGSCTQPGYGYPLAGCIERGHPSYVQMGYWGGQNVAEFLAAERPLIDRLSKRIGYRLVLAEADLPKVITPGQPVTVSLTMVNRGIASVLIPCHVAFGLMDRQGNITARAGVEGADPTAWKPGETVRQSLQATFNPPAPGPYRLCLGLFTDRADPAPGIAIAIEGGTNDRWYPLGTVDTGN